jgi:phage terminase small subunit
MRGRKPVPTALKIAAGVRKDRISTGEPRSAPGSLDPPAWIAGNKHAVEHWNEVAPVLRDMGLLTESSRFALAQLCDEFSIIRSTKRNGAAKD